MGITLALLSWFGTIPWVNERLTNFEIIMGILGKSNFIILLFNMSKPWLVFGFNLLQASIISKLSIKLKTKFEGILKPKKSVMDLEGFGNFYCNLWPIFIKKIIESLSNILKVIKNYIIVFKEVWYICSFFYFLPIEDLISIQKNLASFFLLV